MSDATAAALAQINATLERVLAHLQQAHSSHIQAPDFSQALAWRFRRGRTGSPRLEPIAHLQAIRLDDLREVDAQKHRLLANTRQFVAGRSANNVLLSGARGTGKSSLIKACLNEFGAQGLRLIEIDKHDLVDLPDVLDVVRAQPFRFVVYCDDLSFDAGESGYKALKSVLDGSLASHSSNVLVYATSNRRHLLPEYMSENLTYQHQADGEVHPGEAVEEKISLSERFGLWISFYPFSQDEYLAVVAQWLRAAGASDAQIEAAAPRALLWALERGSRSGRVAYQFAQALMGGALDADT
jgi:uncharacterized protein